MVVTRPDIVRALRELIVALDRRVPRVESAGEASIARDAAMLRAKAVQRLAELADEALPTGDQPRDQVGSTSGSGAG